MDSSSTPWRVLEDPANPSLSQPSGGATGSLGLSGVGSSDRRRLVAIAVLGMAVLLGIAAVVLASGGDTGSVDIAGGVPPTSGGVLASSAAGGPTIVVEVVGAVVRPGVFTLPAGSRVNDALIAAGGYSPRIDAARASRELNLAAILKDGDRVVVPSRDDPPSDAPAAGSVSGGGSGGGAGGSGASAKGAAVDLNHATAAELDALPGIGPVTAAKIIASREEKPFAAIDDLRIRKLVGQKVFDGLRGLITVR